MRTNRFGAVVVVVIGAMFGENVQGNDLEIKSVVLLPIERSEVAVSEPGTVAKIDVREGSKVEAGESLLSLDFAFASLTVQRVEAEFENADRSARNDVRVRILEKSRELATADLRRATESAERVKRSISESELDRLRLELEKVELEIEFAKVELEGAKLLRKAKAAELEIAKHGVARRRLKAPFSGIVSRINIRLGEWAEPAKPALSLIRIDHLYAEGYVDAASADSRLMDHKVTLQMDGRSFGTFTGVVAGISPEVNPVNGQVRVRADIDNSMQKLRPGQTGKLIIHDMER